MHAATLPHSCTPTDSWASRSLAATPAHLKASSPGAIPALKLAVEQYQVELPVSQHIPRFTDGTHPDHLVTTSAEDNLNELRDGALVFRKQDTHRLNL